MRRWEAHQKHDQDITRILTEQDCMGFSRRIRRWRGSKTWDALFAAGHDAMAFEDCSCSQEDFDD